MTSNPSRSGGESNHNEQKVKQPTVCPNCGIDLQPRTDGGGAWLACYDCGYKRKVKTD